MQGLYNLSRDEALTYPDALKRYRQSVQSSFDLYLFNLLLLMKIADYARKDAETRAAKLVPTDYDKNFRPHLADNDVVKSVLENDSFRRITRQRLVENRLDQDQIRRYYKEFAKTEAYDAFQNGPQNNRTVIDILLKIYKFWTSEESFNELMEEQFPAWLDDKSVVIGSIKKTIKALPTEGDFFEPYRPAAETVTEFGETLFHKVYYNNKQLLEVIEPTLKNWDAERVAILDMIALKMAVCELTEFKTIPTKVTLNEFVEIAKLYSTDKSKDFINGILDRLMKQLQKQGDIKKEGRGLID